MCFEGCHRLFPLPAEGRPARVFERGAKRHSALLFFIAMAFRAVGGNKGNDFFLERLFCMRLCGDEFGISLGTRGRSRRRGGTGGIAHQRKPKPERREKRLPRSTQQPSRRRGSSRVHRGRSCERRGHHRDYPDGDKILVSFSSLIADQCLRRGDAYADLCGRLRPVRISGYHLVQAACLNPFGF